MFYENGQLVVSNSKPEPIVDGKGVANDEITIGKPNKLLDVITKNGFAFGNLSIAHLAIWTHEVKSFDVEVAFLTVLSKSENSIRCCKAMEGELARYIKFLSS